MAVTTPRPRLRPHRAPSTNGPGALTLARSAAVCDAPRRQR
jgi:hypothetical protein